MSRPPGEPMKAERYVLLVEDNPDDEELTLLALRENGVANRIEIVRDGAAAVDYIEREGDAGALLPCLVLLDLKLPRLDGFAVLEAIRSHPVWAQTPVVIMTSSSQDEDIARGYASGANSYVRKPVAFEAFQAAVRHIGIYWLMINERARDR